MIFETIITTLSVTGEAHVAPFGIRWQDGLVVISPYRPSTTLQNILETGVAVMNITDDVRVFAGAIAKRGQLSLLDTEQVKAVRLKEVLAHHELTLYSVKEDAERPQLLMTVKHSVTHAPFKGFNRAQAAVVEMAVLVSRLNRLPIEKITQEMQYLQIAIDKTAGEREQEAWQWLVDCVQNHLAQVQGFSQA
jgi:uncharacterized protein